MNPYEATLPNVMARISAWLRCLAWRYRRSIALAAMLAFVVALGLGATVGPVTSPAAAITAN